MVPNLTAYGRILIATADLEEALLQLWKAAGGIQVAGVCGLSLDTLLSRCVQSFNERVASQELRAELARIEPLLQRAVVQRNQLSRASSIRPLAALDASSTGPHRRVAGYLRSRPTAELDAIFDSVASATEEAWRLYSRFTVPSDQVPDADDFEGEATAIGKRRPTEDGFKLRSAS